MKEKKVKHIFELTSHSNDVTIRELDILCSTLVNTKTLKLHLKSDVKGATKGWHRMVA